MEDSVAQKSRISPGLLFLGRRTDNPMIRWLVHAPLPVCSAEYTAPAAAGHRHFYATPTSTKANLVSECAEMFQATQLSSMSFISETFQQCVCPSVRPLFA
jgi:hypothetical protein